MTDMPNNPVIRAFFVANPDIEPPEFLCDGTFGMYGRVNYAGGPSLVRLGGIIPFPAFGPNGVTFFDIEVGDHITTNMPITFVPLPSLSHSPVGDCLVRYAVRTGARIVKTFSVWCVDTLAARARALEAGE